MDAVVKRSCLDSNLKVCDYVESVTDIQFEVDQILEEFYEADGIREKVDKDFKAKIKAIEAQIEENSSCRIKLLHMISSCLKISKLSPSDQVSPEVRKKIKEANRDASKELEQAKLLLNLISNPHQSKVLLFVCLFFIVLASSRSLLLS